MLSRQRGLVILKLEQKSCVVLCDLLKRIYIVSQALKNFPKGTIVALSKVNNERL